MRNCLKTQSENQSIKIPVSNHLQSTNLLIPSKCMSQNRRVYFNSGGYKFRFAQNFSPSLPFRYQNLSISNFSLQSNTLKSERY